MGTPMPTASAAMIGEIKTLPITPNATRIFRLALLCRDLLNFLKIFRPAQTGTPMITPGTATPAIKAMMTGAPMSVATCQRITFFRLHCFFPQNVQPDGLEMKSMCKEYFFELVLP